MYINLYFRLQFACQEVILNKVIHFYSINLMSIKSIVSFCLSPSLVDKVSPF